MGGIKLRALRVKQRRDMEDVKQGSWKRKAKEKKKVENSENKKRSVRLSLVTVKGRKLHYK